MPPPWTRLAARGVIHGPDVMPDSPYSPEACGLGHEVIPFRYALGPAGGSPVVCDGGLMVSGQSSRWGANGIETMMAGQPSIGVERIQQLDSRVRARGPWRRRCMIEHHHGIVRHAFLQ
jgi:hypothetical protein